jgi:glycosyltransferase involved in cell wall biosynthesis
MKLNKVLLFMEFPPPMHGMTYINQIIYDNLKDDKIYSFYDTNFTNDVKEIGNKSFKKVFNNISIMFGAWKSYFIVKPTVVYSLLSASLFGIIRDFMITLPAIIFKKVLVIHLHGFTYYKIYRSNKLYKILFDIMTNNSKIIVLCEKQQKLTLEIMKKDSIILHNCLNYTKRNDNKKKNGLLQLCYISNISKEKGTFDLVNAIKNYKTNIKLIIAGNFLSGKEEFLELIKNEDNISYIGFANEEIKNKLLGDSDIFCLPSKLEEGSPISIIEAMSYGLPIISTNKGCIKDMIQDVGYLLSDNYQYMDIIDGIKYINSNYEVLSKLSLEKYNLNYSQNTFIMSLKDIFDNIKLK